MPDPIQTEHDLFAFFGEPISIYTRREAIADGTLVDVEDRCPGLAREAGFTIPVAFTAEAWADAVEWDAGHGSHQDVTGRLWDVFSVLRYTIRASGGDGSQLSFHVLRVPNRPNVHRATRCDLQAVCGPGDTVEPVLTIMFPHQD